MKEWLMRIYQNIISVKDLAKTLVEQKILVHIPPLVLNKVEVLYT